MSDPLHGEEWRSRACLAIPIRHPQTAVSLERRAHFGSKKLASESHAAFAAQLSRGAGGDQEPALKLQFRLKRVHIFEP
jgi:hypothetical protein